MTHSEPTDRHLVAEFLEITRDFTALSAAVLGGVRDADVAEWRRGVPADLEPADRYALRSFLAHVDALRGSMPLAAVA